MPNIPSTALNRKEIKLTQLNLRNPIPPRWSPRCAVCGEALGDDVTLDIMSISDGVYRLTCPQLVYDGGHDVGVERYYRIDKDNTREVLTGIAMKRWCDRGKLAAVMFEWLMARRLIGREPQVKPLESFSFYQLLTEEEAEETQPTASDTGHA